MQPLPSYACDYYQSVGIDDTKVGKRIGTGTQFEVNDFFDPIVNRERVIKGQIQYLSRNFWNRLLNIATRQSYEQARKEYDLCRKYFPDHMLPTDFYQSKDGQKFALVQDKISFKQITPEIVLASKEVQQQMAAIFNQNGRLIKDEQLLLDVAGMNTGKIIWQAFTGEPYSDNLVLDADGKVTIIDCGLFPVNHLGGLLLQFQEYNAERFGFRFAGMDGGKN